MPPNSSDPSFEQGELPLFESGGKTAEPKWDRVFLGWDRSVLASVTDYLAADWDGKAAWDLSSLLVIVPTRNAGRRLRENLALRAAEEGAAVIPPLVATQEFLFAPDRLPDGPPVADRHVSLMIWSALLLDLDFERFRRVFPVDPVEAHLSWAMKTARELLEVRNLLAESGLSFQTAAEKLAREEIEPARWSELAGIEKLATEETGKLGFWDDTAFRLEAATSGLLPRFISKVVVAASPDLRPIAATALKSHAGKLPLSVLVAAPRELSHGFDSWGRPLPSYWQDFIIDVPNPGETIHAAATPSLQAELACNLAGSFEDPAPFVAIGVPDPEIVPPLEHAARSRGWSTHDPAGQPVSRHGIYYLLEQTAQLLATNDFNAVTRLLRCPDFGKALKAHLLSTGTKAGITGFLEAVDRLQAESLPDRLDDALLAARRYSRKHPEIENGLQWIADWIRRFESEDFGDTVVSYLSEIFADRRFSPTEQAHGAFTEVAEAILEADAAFHSAESSFQSEVPPHGRFQLLLELIRERRLYEERRPGDIDLQGWLELLWEDAPQLIVTGMNDHVVPESIVGHAFLPDSARRQLGIPDNDTRFARDAYLLTTMVETRKQGSGVTHLVFGRQSESGDPLRPSRLLFQCPEEELPERTLQFFSGETPTRQPLPWRLPWKLQPRPLPEDSRIFQKLSVTQFKSYLTCPFRFYLRHGLRMEEFDPGKTEMDARDFGNLLHAVVDQYAVDPEINESADPGEISRYFDSQIDTILFQTYGRRLTTPVLIQRESARKRLAWWAENEAAERESGWRILLSEANLSDDDHSFEIGGIKVTGRIDRIEQHEDGRLRVFDFKTHSIAGAYGRRTVIDYHIAAIKRTELPEQFPAWSLVEPEGGKPSHWIDLQIPLYVLALRNRFGNDRIEAGHIVLGPTQGEILLDPWTGLDDSLLDSALHCAEGVIKAVGNQEFWPPAEKYPWTDAIEEILFSEPEESVDSTLLNATRAGD